MPIADASLVSLTDAVLWMYPVSGGTAMAVHKNGEGDGAVASRVLDALELGFLECLDGTMSKAEISDHLGISRDRFDALVRDFVAWAPGTIELKNTKPGVSEQRHKSLAAVAELQDIWAAMSAARGDNAEFHANGIQTPHQQFDAVETTISHMYRTPSAALQNRTYGEAFCDWLLGKGWLAPQMNVIEVGCGLGYFANALLDTLARKRPDIYETITLTLFDLSPSLANAQRETCAAHLGKIRFVHGDIETHDFKGAKFDLAISNEVIADLSVATISKADLATKYGLQADPAITGPEDTTVVNEGAIAFVRTLGRCLSERGKAIVTEYGTLDGVPKAVRFRNHLEFTVNFSHLRSVAERIGFRTGLGTMGDILGFDARSAPLGEASFQTLSEGIMPLLGREPLPRLAYTRDQLQSLIGPDLDRIANLRFLPLTDPKAFSPFRFFALSLERQADEEQN